MGPGRQRHGSGDLAMARMTVPRFVAKKAAGEKLAMLTAYDFPIASIVDEVGIDAILVGDSCAMTVMGRETTLSITVDELLHHAKTVTDAAKNCLVVADLPFMSYHVSPEEVLNPTLNIISLFLDNRLFNINRDL